MCGIESMSCKNEGIDGLWTAMSPGTEEISELARVKGKGQKKNQGIGKEGALDYKSLEATRNNCATVSTTQDRKHYYTSVVRLLMKMNPGEAKRETV